MSVGHFGVQRRRRRYWGIAINTLGPCVDASADQASTASLLRNPSPQRNPSTFSPSHYQLYNDRQTFRRQIIIIIITTIIIFNIQESSRKKNGKKKESK